MKNPNIDTVRQCAIANMRRVLEILESDIPLESDWRHPKVMGELKGKMREIRRDTVAIDKHLKW